MQNLWVRFSQQVRFGEGGCRYCRLSRQASGPTSSGQIRSIPSEPGSSCQFMALPLRPSPHPGYCSNYSSALWHHSSAGSTILLFISMATGHTGKDTTWMLSNWRGSKKLNQAHTTIFDIYCSLLEFISNLYFFYNGENLGSPNLVMLMLSVFSNLFAEIWKGFLSLRSN